MKRGCFQKEGRVQHKPTKEFELLKLGKLFFLLVGFESGPIP
jgi:hypothetical protein